MKKLIILLVPFLLLGCDGNTTSGDNLKMLELSDDLKTLLMSSPSNERDNLPFNAKASITNSTSKEGYFVATCHFSYLEEKIEDVHFIAVPYSYDLSNNVTKVSNVGYDEHTYSLSNELSVENYEFKGFRISFLTNNDQDGIKVFFKAKNYEPITFSFNVDEIEIES